MSRQRKVVTWAVIILSIGGILAWVSVKLLHKRSVPPIVGAVIRQDTDSNKELPIAGVEITVADNISIGGFQSNSSGFFKIILPEEFSTRQNVTVRFRHPGYQPLELHDVAGDKLYIARMIPMPPPSEHKPERPDAGITNVTVRYSIKTTTALSVGSVAKPFQVQNTGNIPCQGHHPCSPDGKWKASIGSFSLDAGPGNEFRNARVSCIAGPCPFAKIESDGFSRGGQSIRVSARNWSDTTTFLLEAEVYHPMVSDFIHKSYPAIFGQTLNFSLPAKAEGVSIEAEINGQPIVFPLGPSLLLSWAVCNARIGNDQTKVYRCQLKPGYSFL